MKLLELKKKFKNLKINFQIAVCVILNLYCSTTDFIYSLKKTCNSCIIVTKIYYQR